jgi:hypothetical protein
MLACLKFVRGRLYPTLGYFIALVCLGFLFSFGFQGVLDLFPFALLAGIACTGLSWDIIAKTSQFPPVKTAGFWLVLGWLVAGFLASEGNQGFFGVLQPWLLAILFVVGGSQCLMAVWLLRHAPVPPALEA